MATLSSKPNGRRMIQFPFSGTRKTIRLGKISLKNAQLIRAHIDSVYSSKMTHMPLPLETATFLGGIGDELYDRIERTGLVGPRGEAPGQAPPRSMPLGKFFRDYIDKRRADLKERTIANLQQARKSFVGRMGENFFVHNVTKGHAVDWRNSLKVKYSAATIGTFIKKARQVFADAVNHGILEKNPFADIKISRGINARRLRYVTPATIADVLDKCPDAEWRAIFALARFGGLRVPSETLPLKWSDVDWGRRRILVTSPKTEHHEGHENRVIPLFPELEPVLREALQTSEEGAIHVIAKHRGENLRTTAEKIVARAVAEPWPKLFQNLRSSCETDLTARFPIHVVCAWIGNTAAVAMQSYLQVTDQHFSRAQTPAAGAAIDPPI